MEPDPAAVREVMRRNIEELFAKGDVSLLDEVYWPDVIDHNPMPGQRSGHDGLRDVIAAFHEAFPDQEMTLHGTLADGDLGVDFWTFRATHEGELDGWPATGRRVEFSGIDVAKIVDGRIKEIWHVEDLATMWHQLGRRFRPLETVRAPDRSEQGAASDPSQQGTRAPDDRGAVGKAPDRADPDALRSARD